MTHGRNYTLEDISVLTGFLGHYNQLDYKQLESHLQKVLPQPSIPSRRRPKLPLMSNDLMDSRMNDKSLSSSIRGDQRRSRPSSSSTSSQRFSSSTVYRDDGRENKYSSKGRRRRRGGKNRRFESSHPRNTKTATRENDICFRCGRKGHWAYECPNAEGRPNGDVGDMDIIASFHYVDGFGQSWNETKKSRERLV